MSSKKGDTPPPRESDSLDFTEPAVVQPSAPKRVPRPRAAPAEPKRSRKVLVLLLTALGIGVVVYTLMEEETDVIATAPVPVRPGTPTVERERSSSTPQVNTPAPAPVPPRPAAPVESTAPPAIPADFLKAFEAYQKQAGAKAIALALDSAGRWAFGNVAGFAAQSTANQEALAECAKFAPQSGVQASCRLYASGNSVVW